MLAARAPYKKVHKFHFDSIYRYRNSLEGPGRGVSRLAPPACYSALSSTRVWKDAVDAADETKWQKAEAARGR